MDPLREELQLHRNFIAEMANFMLGVESSKSVLPPVADMTDDEVREEVYEMREWLDSIHKLRNEA